MLSIQQLSRHFTHNHTLNHGGAGRKVRVSPEDLTSLGTIDVQSIRQFLRNFILDQSSGPTKWQIYKQKRKCTNYLYLKMSPCSVFTVFKLLLNCIPKLTCCCVYLIYYQMSFLCPQTEKTYNTTTQTCWSLKKRLHFALLVAYNMSLPACAWHWLNEWINKARRLHLFPYWCQSPCLFQSGWLATRANLSSSDTHSSASFHSLRYQSGETPTSSSALPLAAALKVLQHLQLNGICFSPMQRGTSVDRTAGLLSRQ